MEYVIYCDESRHGNEGVNPFMSIGGLWVPRAEKLRLTREIRNLKNSLGIKGELKWQKVSSKYLEKYKRIIDFFFAQKELNYRVIVVEQAKVNYSRYHNNDTELGFYKFYYEMLIKWLEQGNQYVILLDFKTNKGSDRYTDLLKVLRQSLVQGNEIIRDLTVINSAETPLCQICDVITGAVAASWSGIQPGTAKYELANYIAQRGNIPTLRSEDISPAFSKFNIFRIQLD